MEKNTTPQAISRLLSAANIKKGHGYDSGRKRQGKRYTEGFRVHKGFEGIVVEYQDATSNRSSGGSAARIAAGLACIAEVLSAAGIAFKPSDIYRNAFVVEA